jgi:uncharacterized RDD family membrane protein YckC
VPTANSAFAGFPVDSYPVAGKTGTAQIGSVDSGKNFAWFISYAPADAPPGPVLSPIPREPVGPTATLLQEWSAMTKIEPGWYRDPAEPTTQRYWDGEAWVGKPVPADAEPPARPEPLDPAPDSSLMDTGRAPASELDRTVPRAGGFGTDGPPRIIQRGPGVTQPPDSTPIRSLGVTVGWISNDDVRRILDGRELAHAGTRLLARVIDLICLMGLNAVVNGYFIYQYLQAIWPEVRSALQGAAINDIDTSVGTNEYWTVLFIGIGLWFAYEVPSTLNTGQTLGKRIMGIKVASLAPTPPGWGRLTLRWAYAALPLICFPFGAILWILDALYCLWDKPFRQCLHDKSPGTAVIVATTDRAKEPSSP